MSRVTTLSRSLLALASLPLLACSSSSLPSGSSAKMDAASLPGAIDGGDFTPPIPQVDGAYVSFDTGGRINPPPPPRDGGIDSLILIVPDASADRPILQPPPDALGDRFVLPPARDLPTFESLPDRPVHLPGNEATLLVPGRARLIGTHLSACTNGTPATGDRWCAFTKPNVKIGNTDLWVINVTRVLAGTMPRCDGSDPHCKLLIPPGVAATEGTTLWTGQPQEGPAHPTTHRFDGDTLIFHANASPNTSPYTGPIYAWRPGWDSPLKITAGDSGYSCSGHFASDSYVCFENLSVTTPLTFDLTAAKLGAPPKVVRKIVPTRAGATSSQWRAAISRDGNTLIYSTGGMTLSEPETIYVAAFQAPEVSTMVRARASRWSLSTDGTKIYFLANYNYDPQMPAGTLTMADMPSGANEISLAPAVAALQPLAEGEIDRGVAFFDSILAGKATYKIIKDKAMPTQITTVITNIGGVLGVSRDQRFVYFHRDVNPDTGATTDGYIVKTDGSQTTCTLTTSLSSDQFGSPFSRNGTMVFWADNIDQVDGVGEGWVANPDGCTGRKKYADRMDFWFLRNDQGMIFSDHGVFDYATAKFMTFPGGSEVGAVTTVQEGVQRIYGIVPDFKGVLFTLSAPPPDRDGLYLYTKLPF